MTTPPDPVALLRQATAQALAIEDPTDRARTITALLKAFTAEQPALKEARAADLDQIRPGRTYQEIADDIDASKSLVEQILNRRVTGRRAARS